MALYSIGDVAERCGINPVTLRAWQRRYGLLKPQRSEGGHRQFDEEDIQRIEEIKAWIKKGTPVGKVRALLENEKPAKEDDWGALQEDLLAVLRQASPSKLRGRMVKLTREVPVSTLIDNVLNPVRQRLQLEHHTARMMSGVFEGILIQHVAVSLQESLRKPGTEALLIAWDIDDTTGLWLEAWRLAQRDLHITVLPESVTSPRPEYFPGLMMYVWTGRETTLRQTELLQHWREQGYSVTAHTSPSS